MVEKIQQSIYLTESRQIHRTVRILVRTKILLLLMMMMMMITRQPPPTVRYALMMVHRMMVMTAVMVTTTMMSVVVVGLTKYVPMLIHPLIKFSSLATSKIVVMMIMMNMMKRHHCHNDPITVIHIAVFTKVAVGVVQL